MDLPGKPSKVSSEVFSSYGPMGTRTEKLVTFVLVRHYDFHLLTGSSGTSVGRLALFFGREVVPNWNGKHRCFKVQCAELFHSCA